MEPHTPPPGRPSAFEGYIGVSRNDITPPAGIYARNWGAASRDVATGVHRPLTMTCYTFQTGKHTPSLVLIGADLGWWKNSEHERIFRTRILEALSLHPSQLMFCLSHTHAGPGLCPDDAGKPGGALIQPYLDSLARTAIIMTENALAAAEPAILTWAYGTCKLATHRDFPEPGGARILTGWNPDVPADDTLLVGRITNKKGATTGTLVNYACHPTTLAWENTLISPDYPGAMREVVETATAAPCLFLQGASGDLAPAEQYSGDTGLADRHGRQLGYAVLSTIASMLPPSAALRYHGMVESGAPLAMWKQTAVSNPVDLAAEMVQVEFPLKNFPLLETLEQEWAQCTDPVLKERLWRKRCIRKAIGDGDTAKIPLWVWKLGDAVLAGQPNEPYAVFQTAIRAQFPSRAIALISIVNGSVGYLPPEALYAQNAYPVWQTPFAAGSLDILKHTTLQTIHHLTAAP